MRYKEIVYLEYSGATLTTLATHQALAGKHLVSPSRKTLGLSTSSAISKQDQAKSPVRMHSVRAIVMHKPYCHPSFQVQFIGYTYISLTHRNNLELFSILFLESYNNKMYNKKNHKKVIIKKNYRICNFASGVGKIIF